ncbi:E3 ubiquitin-protein ligase RAD18-like isoform X2 [Venturia canescens]|uniref:E3 ubiquitin-protein ligase RAD18-like isoform X2 n=1 Tax=Venturia canescens TaxID=32260 RepID=UPI001C9CEF7D|nr:E3 ubiquitin-protein ligase RAD18-like isoform X2 [Venturia canescens]
MMGKLAQIKWPQEYSELQRIEELLLCGICYEYMDTSVMTPCSHNYCSLCIRKYLHFKTQCPACFEKTFEKDLHTNRILDEIVTYFGKVREKLASCITDARIVAVYEDANQEDSVASTPVRPARTNQCLKKVSPKIEPEKVQVFGDSPKIEPQRVRVFENSPRIELQQGHMFGNSPKTALVQVRTMENSPRAEKVQTFVAVQQKITSSPSTSSGTKIAKIFTPKSRKRLVPVVTNGKSVPCPVCAVEVPEAHINRHLDDCLKRETIGQKVAKIEPKRKPLPKLVVSLMKDAELRKKVKELGLPTQGDRKTLEARFHRYLTLYNAECDKKEPRAIEALVKQCEYDENLEKKMLKMSQVPNRLGVTRSCEQNTIEEAQKKYLETNRQNFNDLIASIRERESKKRPVRRSLISKPEIESQEARSEVQPAESNETVETSSAIEDDPMYYSIHAHEATFYDSDSESSCPLQHYTSDDTVNFHSFEMAVSESSPEKNVTSGQSCSRTFEENKNQSQEYPSPEEKDEPDKSIYSATTDNETSDEDYIPPSPNTTISHTTKRAKFSLRASNQETNNFIQSNDQEKDILAGHKLAMSIVQDFTYDSSSNDATHDGVGFGNKKWRH